MIDRYEDDDDDNNGDDDDKHGYWHDNVDDDRESERYSTSPSPPLCVVGERKFEYVELCRTFLGRGGERAYLTAVCISVYAQLWGFTCVFSSAMAAAV